MLRDWYLLLIFFILFLLMFGGLIYAQRVELFLNIENPSVSAGEAIKGTAIARVYERHGGGISHCEIGVDFGDSTPSLRFPCSHDPNTGGTSGYTECQENFVHVYTTAGTKTIRMYASCGGHGAAALKTFSIIVSPAPTSSPPTVLEPGIAATSIEEIIERIVQIIYWIFTSLAVIIILIGGFIVLTSAGNPRLIAKGRQAVLYTLLGFALLTLSRGIIELIFVIIGRG